MLIQKKLSRFVLLAFNLIFLAACTQPPSIPSPTLTLTKTQETITSTTLQSTNTPTKEPPTKAPITIPTTEQPSVTPILATGTSTSTAVPSETPLPAESPTQQSSATPVPIPVGHVELDGAQLPPGFSLRKVIEVDRPIGLQFDPTGTRFYITTQTGELRIYNLADQESGVFDYSGLINGFRFPHGLAFHPETNDLYISTAGKISILRDTDQDGVEDEIIPLVEELPFDLHQNNVPKFGPDGKLYIGVGSTCDACIEEDIRSGTIMRFDPETGDGEIVAEGLRNPFDIAFHPETGDLFATDNGRDDLGDFDPAEELNHIVLGNDYGWPDCWNDFEGIKCEGTTKAIGFYTAHASVNNLLFYTGNSFPAEYTNDLFALNFGSFLVQLDTGLQKTKLLPDGQGSYTTETEWFLKMPQGSYPLGLALGPDGSIYFGDYINGGIWRISYGN